MGTIINQLDSVELVNSKTFSVDNPEIINKLQLVVSSCETHDSNINKERENVLIRIGEDLASYENEELWIELPNWSAYRLAKAILLELEMLEYIDKKA